MQYVQIDNGQIIRHGLPTTGYLKDDSSVSGYNQLDEKTLKSEGWLPLVEEVPEYNAETQYLQHDSYVIEADRVISKYVAVDMPIPEPQVPQPTIEDYLVDLDYRLSMIELGL